MRSVKSLSQNHPSHVGRPSGTELPTGVGTGPKTVCRLGLVVAAAALCATRADRVEACTLWGAAGSAAGGGTIVCKNRDWKPDHTQVLKMRRSEEGYAYFGLCTVYATQSTEGMAAGVNEKGLTAFTAATSSLPSSTWKDRKVTRNVTTPILLGYATCDEVLAKRDALFSSMRPTFVMIADRTKILMVEVGLDGKYALKTIENGVVGHANHYLDKTLAEFNVNVGDSSRTRQDRIDQLLKTSRKPFTIDTFAAIGRDQHDGPDNSLWRSGKVARTLASWIVACPRDGAPRLRVVIANPDQKEETHVLVLDERFWKATE